MITLIYQRLQIKLRDKMFVHYNNKIVNSKNIKTIMVYELNKYISIGVHYYDGLMEEVQGAEAINLVMRLCPSVVEGMRAKHIKHSWAVHNLIGHPLMQLFIWFRLTKLALWFHDATIPKPLLN